MPGVIVAPPTEDCYKCFVFRQPYFTVNAGLKLLKMPVEKFRLSKAYHGKL